MEGLAPSLRFALAIRLGIERGVPLREILKEYLAQNSDELTKCILDFYIKKERGISIVEMIIKIKSPYRRALFQIIERGLAGEPILVQIVQLEEEIKEACLLELDQKIATMSIKALIPLLLFQFPALLILLFAPFLNLLTQSAP